MFQPSIRVDKPNEGNPKKNPMDKAIISRIWTFCLGCFFLSFLFGFFVGRFAVEGLLRGPAGAARVQHRKGHQSRSGSYPSDAILIGIEEIRRDVHFSKGNHTVLGPIILLPSRLIRALWKRKKRNRRNKERKEKKSPFRLSFSYFLPSVLSPLFFFFPFFCPSISLSLSLSLSFSLFLSLSGVPTVHSLGGQHQLISLWCRPAIDSGGRWLAGVESKTTPPPPHLPPTNHHPPP